MANAKKQGVRKQGPEEQGPRDQGAKGTRKQGSREQGSEGAKEPDDGEANRATKPKRKRRGNGAELLKKAADKVVAENSEEIANLLLKHALKGKMESARMLVTLSEKKEQPKAKKRRGPSVADRLAAEPEWEEPRHGGLTAADLKGSEEDWEQELSPEARPG